MKIVRLVLLSLSVVMLAGCSSMRYYFDAIDGHFDILAKQKAIKDILQQESTPAELRLKLELALQARNFASSEMLLPENDSYRYYSDIKRSYAVWNVIATEKFSIKAHQWCFLVIGCVSYRGYFNREDAQSYAESLASQGYDVNISGAQAYSTLGWFDDPLLNTMIEHSEARLVGIIIHELAHQQVYINNDSSFNEAFATSVELEGIKRWFVQQSTLSSASNKQSYHEYLQSRKRADGFKQLLKSTQFKLDELYQSNEFKNSENKLDLKKQVFTQLQQHYQRLKKSWKNYTGYDQWMAQNLNNAHLALIATYQNKVPAFQAILKSVDNNIKKYYQTVEEIGALPEEERNSRLAEYKSEAGRLFQ